MSNIPILPLCDEDGVILPQAEADFAVFYRSSAWNYDRDQASMDAGAAIDEESMTHQEFKEEADINTIVERFGLTGEMPDNIKTPSYGDFTGIGDFKDAMNAINEAKAAFMSMPAKIREQFGNDPQRLLEFMADDANRDEAKRLGLLPEPAAPERTTITAVDELAKLLKPPEIPDDRKKN